MISAMEKKQADAGNKGKIGEFRAKVEDELNNICLDILQLLDEKLLPAASAVEAKVFYQKMKGDYLRYLAEIASGDKKKDVATRCGDAYAEVAPPPPPSRTKWTRLVHPPVLIGHVWSEAGPGVRRLPLHHLRPPPRPRPQPVGAPPPSPPREPPARPRRAASGAVSGWRLTAAPFGPQVFFYEIQEDAEAACSASKKAFEDATADLEEARPHSTHTRAHTHTHRPHPPTAFAGERLTRGRAARCVGVQEVDGDPPAAEGQPHAVDLGRQDRRGAQSPAPPCRPCARFLLGVVARRARVPLEPFALGRGGARHVAPGG